MSEENVETVVRAVEAWNANDLDGYLAELDPDTPPIEPGLEGGEYRGGAWERLTMRPREFRDLGESVLALAQIDLVARITGIEFSQEIGSLLEFRGGKDRSRPRLPDTRGRPRSRRAEGVGRALPLWTGGSYTATPEPLLVCAKRSCRAAQLRVSLDQVAQALLDARPPDHVLARLRWPQLAPNDAGRISAGHFAWQQPSRVVAASVAGP
jgi:ketosteroid isomerase-like protein